MKNFEQLTLAENIFSNRHKTSRVEVTLNKIKTLVDWDNLEQEIAVIDKTQTGKNPKLFITLTLSQTYHCSPVARCC